MTIFSERTRWWIAGTTLAISVFLLLWSEYQHNSIAESKPGPSAQRTDDQARED